jgi:PAS domain S-box-containing protein
MAIPNSFDILQAVIEATPDAIFVKDLEGRYLVVNAAAARFLGRRPEDIIGKHDLELYPEDTARQFIADDHQVLTSGTAMTFEGVATSETGIQAYLVTKGVYRDASGTILGIFGISHDMTELRQAHEALERTREALFRAQKMEAVGQLTGGLAHDFNNVLAVILGNLELLRIHLKGDATGGELIEVVLRAAAHAQELTTNLLAFARRRQLNPQMTDINTLVERMVRLLSRTLPARISMSTDLSADARLAVVDAAALEAAILNVVLNARDAMPKGGSLCLRTARAEVTSPPATDDDPAAGVYAVVEVEDTGVGMTPEILAHVFEPFFTTKTEGGTGLGLSMVQGFAKQCGGAVSIASTPGNGTTVRIFLPIAAASIPPGAAGRGARLDVEFSS